jgi:hypothetical protein
MPPITADLVARAADILGDERLSEEDIDLRLDELTSSPTLSARLRNFVPEAFAYAFIPHLPDGTNVVMPKEFSARNASGAWQSVPLAREPVFLMAVQLAMHIHHNGPRSVFKGVVSRSAMLDCVNKLLNEGQSLAGANMSGLAIAGVLAEEYPPSASEA